MSFLGVLEALRGRLEGRSFQYVPPLSGVLAEPVVHITAEKAARVRMEIGRKTSAAVGQFDVPVHFYDPDAWKEHFPALAFSVIAVEPRFDDTCVYVNEDYGAGMFNLPIEHSSDDVVLHGTDLGSMPRMSRTRAVMTPCDYLVEIRAYAMDVYQSAVLMKYVYERFPPRHFLRVPMIDGTHRSWDLIFREYKDLDKREAVIDQRIGVHREYAMVWTYLVEGYMDNTDTTKLVNLVRGYTLGLEAMEEETE